MLTLMNAPRYIMLALATYGLTSVALAASDGRAEPNIRSRMRKCFAEVWHHDSTTPQKQQNDPGWVYCKTDPIENHYKFEDGNVGKTKHSTVLKARHRTSGKYFAVKVIEKFLKKWQSLGHFRQEVMVMCSVKGHPNIIELIRVFEDETKLYLVMELCEGGNLLDYVNGRNRVPEEEARSFMKQIMLALEHLHGKSIGHFDLKLENFVIKSNDQGNITIKMIDFGHSHVLLKGKSCTKLAGTTHYMAPEMLYEDRNYNLSADMWAIGVTLYTVIFKRRPFHGCDEKVIYENITSGFSTNSMEGYCSGHFPGHDTPCSDWGSNACRNFIIRCLLKSPKGRMTAKQALEHHFLKDVQYNVEPKTKCVKNPQEPIKPAPTQKYPKINVLFLQTVSEEFDEANEDSDCRSPLIPRSPSIEHELK